MPNSPFTFSTTTANVGMSQLASSPATSFGNLTTGSSGLNIVADYATSQHLGTGMAIAQPVMTVAQIKQRLKDFKKSVSDKLKALKTAWKEFEEGLSIEVTTIKQLVTILEEVRQALNLLGDLENTLAEFREFLDDYGSYISVPASVLKGITEASAWTAQTRAQFANAENIILSSFSDRHASRVELSVDSALDWDESPTIYQATSIAHGHMLCYRMRLKANGYSLGELLNTFALGPCQKKQISVLEFGREEVASRKEALDATESLESSLSRDRDVSEVLSASISEKIKGKSRSTTAGWSGGTGISGSGSGQKGPLKGAVGATSGFMGSLGISGARSSQKSSRKIAASSMQRLRERINQSASAVRSQRATVVESVSQTERVSAVTEVIANKNMCHSMNFMFFEVLKHFVIEQALVDVQEVLYIPLQITPFSPEKILRWQDILYDFVPSSQLRAGFADLAEWQKGNYAPNRLIADESIQDMSGHMVMSFDLPLPEINDPEIEDGDEIPATHDFGPAWSFYRASRFSLFTRSYYKSYFFRRNFRSRQQIWETQMVPKIVPEFMEELQIWANTPSGAIDLKLDITQLTRFRHGAKMSIKLATTSSTPAIRRSDIQSLEIRSGRQVPSNARILIESASLSYRAESLNGFIFRDTRLQNDIGNSDAARIVTPLNAEEMRNPRKEQERRANTLIEHLNSNREIYHEILAKEMDEHRRFMLLDGIRLPAAGNRSVANLVENRIVGFVGNSMILPVAQGLRIDPIFHEIEDLLDFYKPLEEMEPFRMSLPTGGYFMEAVMGTCNSCEDLDYTKARFNGFACEDEPSGIEPISMDSRRAAPSDLQAKDFAAPIVAFQNVPNAPDPTGLGAAMQVLGNSDTFRDATGLAATQANAMAALAKTADGAEAMANISADLTKQAFAGIADVTVDRDLARIQDQLDKGNISGDDAKSLIKDVLGNKSKSTQAPSDTDKKSVIDKPEIINRIKDGSDVTYNGEGESLRLTDDDEKKKKSDLEILKEKYQLLLENFRNFDGESYDFKSEDMRPINVRCTDPSTLVINLTSADEQPQIPEYPSSFVVDIFDIAEGFKNASTHNSFIGLIELPVPMDPKRPNDTTDGIYLIEISDEGIQVLEKWISDETDKGIVSKDLIRMFLTRVNITFEAIDNIVLGFNSHGNAYSKAKAVFSAKSPQALIDAEELATVFNLLPARKSSSSTYSNNLFDLLIFDMCLNGNIENLYAFKNYTPNIMGSEVSFYGLGVYETIMSRIDNIYDTEGFENWMISIPRTYNDALPPYFKKEILPLALLDTSRADDFAQKISDFCGAVIATTGARLDDLKKHFKKARRKADELGAINQPWYQKLTRNENGYDLHQFLVNLRVAIATDSQFSGGDLESKLISLIDFLNIEESVIKSYVVTGKPALSENLRGLGIWFPRNKNQFNKTAAQQEGTSYEQVTAWVQMVKHLYNP